MNDGLRVVLLCPAPRVRSTPGGRDVRKGWQRRPGLGTVALAVMVVFSLLLLVATLVLLVAEVVALIDAARTRPDAFPAAGKLTKNAWLGILGLSLVVTLFLGLLGAFLLGLLAAVATIVYFVDVRPALKEITGGGPYGGY